MTDSEKKDLLELAKGRYPPGTKFKDGFKEWEATSSPWFYSNDSIAVRAKGQGGTCYRRGEWAEIVSWPKGYNQELIYSLF